MPKRPQHYYRPKSLDEALALLNQPDSAPLAGGTRLLANDVPASIVVDLQDLNLSGLADENGVLHVGAMTRLAELHAADIPEILKVAIYRAGANTFRNAATLGGLIASREPDSELLALLLTLHTTLIFADREPLSLADYLAPDERLHGLITDVQIPYAGGIGAIERVARTPADTPIVAVAVWKMGQEMNVAACGISARPMLVEMDNLQVTHPGDFRGSVDYRREMLTVLLRRALDSLG